MSEFVFYQPTRLEFGCKSIERLGTIAKKYGNKCLLVTTTNAEDVLRPLYDRVKSILTEAGVEYVHFDEVVPNPAIQGIEKAIKIVKEENIELVIAVGGGSSMDTAKAISLFHEKEELDWGEIFSKYTSAFAWYESLGKKLPVIAVPTTAGTGSELTQAMVISDPDQNEKMCIFHQEAFPEVALIDPELTKTLPPYLTAMTGFDAFTHSFESFMRECASDYTKMLGLKSMEIIINTLPKLVKDTANMELREQMSKAASFSGISLSNAAASIPHPLSEIIGGIVPRIAHGQCLACVYPAYLDYLWENEPEKCAVIAGLFDKKYQEMPVMDAAKALPELIGNFLAEIGVNKNLSELGVTEEELAQMVNHPVLGFLPFAPQATLQEIVRKSYK